MNGRILITSTFLIQLLKFCSFGFKLEYRRKLTVRSEPLFYKPRVITTTDLRWEVLAIGRVESPFHDRHSTPRQSTISLNETTLQNGRLVIFDEYRECLNNLDGFDYIWAITCMHLNSGFKKCIRPQPVADAEGIPPQQVGLFSSRAPHRPNPIALSALKLRSVNVVDGIIEVEGLDLINDTPILDIKPYIPAFDAFPNARAGWMDTIRSDPMVSRINGYQTIYSARGARGNRAGIRRRAMQEQSQSVNQTQPIVDDFSRIEDDIED